MKKKFKVEGIDCPVCAGKIEARVGEIQGVTSSKINYMAEKLTVEIEDSIESSIEGSIVKIVKEVEPDAVVTAL